MVKIDDQNKYDVLNLGICGMNFTSLKYDWILHNEISLTLYA